MVHILELPGCFLRASSHAEVIHRLPQVIMDYLRWHYLHGGAIPKITNDFGFEVTEEFNNIGPFDPGDAAALFTPEYQPITLEEMEPFFSAMAYSRSDLLDLVNEIPDELLDWQPEPGVFSMRRILRHIGNAEEWYVSRILTPDKLPDEWANDENLPTDQFLEMERRTALVCLQNLTDTQRSSIFHPVHFTSHPTEAWALRKVLRRFIEHEREHTAQIINILRDVKD